LGRFICTIKKLLTFWHTGRPFGKMVFQSEIPLMKIEGIFFGAPSMGALLRVQVPPHADHSEQSEAQLREGTRPWEGSANRKS
jgi:hypothetical protein